MHRAKVGSTLACLLLALGCHSSAHPGAAETDDAAANGSADSGGGGTTDSLAPAVDGALADGIATATDGSPATSKEDAGDAAPSTGADAPLTGGPAIDAPTTDAPAGADLSTATPDSAVAPVGDAAGGPPGASTVCYREGTCGRGWGCVNRDYSSSGHCMPLGIAGSYCRTSPGSAPCDPGLACVSELVFSQFVYPSTINVFRSFCRPTTGLDGSCVAATCSSGTCPPSGPARCAANGAANGACRDTTPRCDAPLGCGSDNRCHPMSPYEICSDGGTLGCPEGKGCPPNSSANKCTALGTSGGACRPTAPRCDGMLACKGGSCQAGPRLGEYCGYLTSCEDGAACLGSTCVAAAVGSLFAPCRPDDSCDAGLTCADNHLCSNLFGTEGHLCGPSSKCLPGLYCSSNTCRKRVALDQPCSGADNQCIEGTACGYPSGHCVQAGILGNPCRTVAPGSGDVACDDGLVCDLGTCRVPQTLPTVKLGQPCSAALNACENGAICSSGVCVASGGFNAPCRMSPGGPCQQELGCSFDRRCVSGKHAGESCGGTLPTALPCALPTICAGRLDGSSVCADVGYTETPIATPDWVDACADGVHVTAGFGRAARDDGHPSTALLLPFPLRLWGSDVTQVWPSTNGFLGFGKSAPDDRRGGEGLFPAQGLDAIVAPFWDDLYLDPSVSDICFKTAGTAPNRRFVIEWLNAHRFGHPDVSLTFEVALTETSGVVDFVYQKLDAAGADDRPYADGSRAGIGLQAPGAVRYIVHDHTLVAGQGLRFTPP